MGGPPDGVHESKALDDAERDQQIWQMRVDAHTQQQIADHFGITQQAVSYILKKVYQQRTEPVKEELRAAEADKLDRAEAAALAVLRARHVHINAGKVAVRTDPETGVETEVEDDAPVLAAIDRLLKISAARRAMFGLDAPVKAEITAYNYSVNGITPESLT